MMQPIIRFAQYSVVLQALDSNGRAVDHSGETAKAQIIQAPKRTERLTNGPAVDVLDGTSGNSDFRKSTFTITFSAAEAGQMTAANNQYIELDIGQGKAKYNFGPLCVIDGQDRT